jgi:hypothetical protein
MTDHDHDDDADTLGPIANPARWYHYVGGFLLLLIITLVVI